MNKLSKYKKKNTKKHINKLKANNIKTKKKQIGGTNTQHIKPTNRLSLFKGPEDNDKNSWEKSMEDIVNQGPGFPPDPPLNECIIL